MPILEYLYNKDGFEVGFTYGVFVCDSNGNAVGQLRDSHVYKMSGEYVGEFYEGMVVDKGTGSLVPIPAAARPPRADNPGNRNPRGVADHDFEDVFEQLL